MRDGDVVVVRAAVDCQKTAATDTVLVATTATPVLQAARLPHGAWHATVRSQLVPNGPRRGRGARPRRREQARSAPHGARLGGARPRPERRAAGGPRAEPGDRARGRTGRRARPRSRRGLFARAG